MFGEKRRLPMLLAAAARRPRTGFLISIAVVYGATILIAGGLVAPYYRDEGHFWKTSQYFVERLPPTAEELRTYPELMTPLSFLMWAGFERLFGLGLTGARLLTLTLSVAIALMVGMPKGRVTRSSVLATVGLFLFPYFLFLSVHAYTDMTSAFFVVAAFAVGRRGHFVASALSFVCAIATRQYMVVFPLAVAAWELSPWRPRAERRTAYGLLSLGAAASLGGWYLFFGGLTPPGAPTKWVTPQEAVEFILPSHGAYFLSCIAVYFVIPEMVLFRRWRTVRELASLWGVICGVAVGVFFYFYSPWIPAGMGGAVNRLTYILLPDAIRELTMPVLAWLTVVRFSRVDLAFWLMLGSFALMFKTWVPWDKYSLPLIATLWILTRDTALSAADAGAEVARSEDCAQADARVSPPIPSAT